MKAEVQRVDHLGIVAGVIHDLKIIEMIDERIPLKQREEISTGEAVAGRIAVKTDAGDTVYLAYYTAP